MGINPIDDDKLLDKLDEKLDKGVLDLLGTSKTKVRKDLENCAPLWFYILREAELEAGGGHLGPVGGRIVAEVLIGVVAADPESYLALDPDWTPTLPAHEGAFGLRDLLVPAVD
jgi:hypothetical protein